MGKGHPAFIIAELSGNHHQKYEEAEALVRAAAEAGADAVKLQTYTPDTITLHSNKEWFVIGGKDQPDSWKKKVLWDLYQTAYTPWDWQPKLKELAERLGLILFSTPFDDTAVDFLETMNVPCYKIASYEAVHIPLIKKIAKIGKPVIMSAGLASLDEVDLAIKTLRENGTDDITVLHCVTAYSDKPIFEESNLRVIRDVQNRFGVVAGFSDNNSGIEIPVIATTVAGGSIIEKHLILDRSNAGPDAKFSIEPNEFKEMVNIIRRFEREGIKALKGVISQDDIEKTMGKVWYGPASSKEKENILFRPSVWVKKNMKKGEKLTKENIRVARPGAGLAPKFFEEMIGKTANQDIEEATPLSFDLIDSSCIVRQVLKEDSKRIWEIRNNPVVRKLSSSEDVISFENHVKWFEQMYMNGKKNLCFVIECQGNIAGYCRFDFDDANEAFTVSIAIDPTYHGKGLGHQLLSGSLLYIPQTSIVNAAVQKGNPASVALFKKNNFAIDHEDEQYYYFRFMQRAS